MSSLDEREKAFENKFKHDEEQRFKANARAMRLFGLWAAAQMKHANPEAYADEVLSADFDEPGVMDAVRKVQKDLAGHGIEFSEHHLETQFNVHLAEAMNALKKA